MKTFLTTLFFISGLTLIFSQDLQWGIQGGTNYNFSGDLVQHWQNDTVNDVFYRAKSIQGYHGGVWLKYGEDTFVKTELLYSKFDNEYKNPLKTYTISRQKIDIPIVVGFRIFGPVFIFAGPDFQYILNEDFSLENSQITYDSFTTGLHLGAGVKFRRFAVDLRWDKGLAESDSAIVNSEFVDSNFTLDNRPNQLMLSLHITLNK